MMPCRTPRLVILLALALCASVTRADQLIKTDGKRLDGRIVAEDKDSITFETNRGGISMRQRVARAQIQSIHRTVREGPGYAPIPIVGTIGDEVTADTFEAAINASRQSNPKYIVLLIDTDGGDVQHMAKIVEVIAQNRDLRFIAYVKKALSAGAIIAMSCPEIYMTPQATIGAAVPYLVGPDGTPRNVEAKFQSALHAHMRAAARLGGHDDLWVRGMTEIDLELTVTGEQPPRLMIVNGAPTTAPGDPSAPPLVKRGGQILTVTANEARRYGLSRATVLKLDDVRATLGLKAWHQADERGWFVMTRQHDAVVRQRQQRRQLDEKLAERRDYIDTNLPEMMRIVTQIDQANLRIAKAKARLEQIGEQMKERARTLDDEQRLALRRAATASHAIENSRRINADFDARRKALVEEYRPEAERLIADAKAAGEEADRLDARRQELLASTPMDQ